MTTSTAPVRSRKRSLADLGEGDLRGKRVLVRADLNVPLEGSTITDDTRIRATLPTLETLVKAGARVILTSHLGRPKGVTPALTLAPVAARLGELLGKTVALAPDAIGAEVEALVSGLADGDVLLLENIRFHPEEEKNDPAFAKALAGLGDFYVNDAFGTAHRAHASTAGVAAYLPAVAGFLLEKEIRMLGDALEAPERPFVVVLGGSKVSSKIGVIRNLLGKADALVIGGGMIFTFLAAKGLEVGTSLVEADRIELARELLAEAESRGTRIVLPVDIVVASEFKATEASATVAADAMPAGFMGLDVGPETVKLVSDELAGARTILWNGPMGVFENPAFAAGTRAVGEAIAARTDAGAITLVGGGDSVAAVELFGLGDRFSHVSTGGGASLEFLEGLELPGVACLQEA
jgi:phosphoglycerate kinase